MPSNQLPVLLGILLSAAAQAADPAPPGRVATPLATVKVGDATVKVGDADANGVASLPDPSAAEAPRLTLSGKEWNFGQRWVGVPTATEILMKNEGKTPLTIGDVRTSCGCAAATPKSGGVWQGKVIPPGGSEPMTIAYNTARPSTNVSRTITVVSDDPKEPQIVITIKGEVRNPFEGRPVDRIAFGRVVSDAALSHEIELVNITGQPLTLKLQPSTEESAFDMRLTEVQPGQVYRLAASTRPPLKAGASMTEVQLVTGVPRFPSQNIPVSAFVSAPAFITPVKLQTDLTKPVQRLLRLSYLATDPIKISEIRSTHPDLVKAELMPRRAGAAPAVAAEFEDLNIKVSLPPGSQLPAGATIEVHTTHPKPEYRKFVVPIELQPARAAAPAAKALASAPGGK